MQPVLLLLFLTQKKIGQKKGSGSPAPLKAEPGHNFFEIHHQALFWFILSNELSSVFAFHGSLLSSVIFLMFIIFKPL